MEDLDGDHAVHCRLFGLEHLAHPPLADSFENSELAEDFFSYEVIVHGLAFIYGVTGRGKVVMICMEKRYPRGPTLWRPRCVEPGECEARERLANSIPPGADRLGLHSLAELLKAGRADLEIVGFGPVGNNAVPEEGTIVALLGGGDGRGQRMALVLSDSLARDLVDTTLARSRGSVEKRLTSGEEGALLFALDRAGGDWMNLGGGGFRIKGILADSMQIAEYLQGPPKWWVRAVLETESAVGEAWLMLRDPARFGGVSPRRTRIDRALDWPVEFKIIVGTSRVPVSELSRINTRDVLVLDWSAFVARDLDKGVARFECGRVRRFARLLDRGRLELVSTDDLRGSMNDTENVELKVRLSQPSDDDAGSMDVVVQVEVGRVTMTVDQAINLVPGRMIKLDRDVGPEVLLRAGGKLIARGELVDQEGRLAVEVTEVT